MDWENRRKRLHFYNDHVFHEEVQRYAQSKATPLYTAAPAAGW